MNKIINWLSEVFAPKVSKIFSNPWLAATSAAMQKCIPFILTGSLIFIYNVFQPYVSFLPDLTPIMSYSFGILTLITTFMLINQCMEKLAHHSYTINAGIAGIGVLMMIANPFGEQADSLSSFLSNLGPAGLAVGIVVGLFVSIVFHLWAKIRLWEDSSLPDFVVAWVNTIIPNVLVLGTAMVLVFTLQINMYQVILNLFMPLVSIGQTLPGWILICLIPAILYSFGVSSWTLTPIANIVYFAAIAANIEAVAAGQAATNIVTYESVYTLNYITMGGMCCTLPLGLLMLFGKSREVKTLGKIYLVPNILNINEPIMFGSVVFNPYLMAPTWICTVVGVVYTWILMSTGLLAIPAKAIQVSQIPAPFCCYLAVQDWRAIPWFFVLMAIYLVIWFPFFKAWDNSKVKEEKLELANETE